jgi:ATP phosphoribosyltransferase
VQKTRIAIPNKGRMGEEISQLFSDSGVELKKSFSQRALIAAIDDQTDVIFANAKDIPEFVATGVVDAGITGHDQIRESGSSFDEILDLQLGHCRLCVLVRADSSTQTVTDLPAGSRVATSFPNLTNQFFVAANVEVKVVPISGAAEVAPIVGVSDLVVDLVSTGLTMQLNNLREIAEVVQSSARLIVKQGALSERVENLATVLDSGLQARSQRYVMVNVTGETLDAARAILHGLSGPTVMNIADDKFALHAVVPANAINDVITRLKRAGATGIVVTRIERLVP